MPITLRFSLLRDLSHYYLNCIACYEHICLYPLVLILVGHMCLVIYLFILYFFEYSFSMFPLILCILLRSVIMPPYLYTILLIWFSLLSFSWFVYGFITLDFFLNTYLYGWLSLGITLLIFIHYFLPWFLLFLAYCFWIGSCLSKTLKYTVIWSLLIFLNTSPLSYKYSFYYSFCFIPDVDSA